MNKLDSRGRHDPGRRFVHQHNVFGQHQGGDVKMRHSKLDKVINRLDSIRSTTVRTTTKPPEEEEEDFNEEEDDFEDENDNILFDDTWVSLFIIIYLNAS